MFESLTIREYGQPMTLVEYSTLCVETSFNHGFWDDKDPNDVSVRLEKLMLVVTEVAEAAEAVRTGDEENLKEELADVLIRVFDLCGANGYNMDEVVQAKMEKNEKRPRMHGKLA